MRLVRISEPVMSSCLTGAGRNTATTATATYGFDHELEFLKSASASVRASPHSSSSSSSSSSLSSCFTSSSPNSTVFESSNSLSPPLSICTRRPRTHRKRPNQTYNEAAALLSTAYPNIFSPKHLAKPPSFKFAKPIDIASWLNSAIEEELLLPLPLPEKPCEPRLGLVTSSSCSNYSDSSSEKPCWSPMEDNGLREGDDFDAESILDEEIGGGIDSIMGNLTVKNDNGDHNQQQQTSNYCYGIPMGLGLGLPSGGFDFGYGMTRGVRAFRNSPHSGYGGADEWWRFPTMTTVDVGAISPTLEKKPAVEKKKSRCKKEEEKEGEGAEAIPPARQEIPAASSSDCRIQLKLNYDDVLTAWSDRGSPFSDGSLASELSGRDALTRLAQIDLFGENGGVREASVQRYKEKRRNRLFSKKIRYQVRKVNADQRPRMKGRFVRGSESSAGAQQ